MDLYPPSLRLYGHHMDKFYGHHMDKFMAIIWTSCCFHLCVPKQHITERAVCVVQTVCASCGWAVPSLSAQTTLSPISSRTFAKSLCHTFLPYRVCVNHAHSCPSPPPIRCGKAALLSQRLTLLLVSHFNVPAILKTVIFRVSETSAKFYLNIPRQTSQDGDRRKKIRQVDFL